MKEFGPPGVGGLVHGAPPLLDPPMLFQKLRLGLGHLGDPVRSPAEALAGRALPVRGEAWEERPQNLVAILGDQDEISERIGRRV